MVECHIDGGNGVTIGTAQSDGVHVDWALHDGFFVCQAGGVGACTPSSVNHGLEVGNAQGDGVRVTVLMAMASRLAMARSSRPLACVFRRPVRRATVAAQYL